MKKKALLENISSLGLLKIFEYALPLLTVPYLVRVLGISNFGLYSFIITFMSYFEVITNYGFNLTATREIAINKQNFSYVNKVVATVYFLKVILSVFCYLLLCLVVYFIPQFNEAFYVYSIAYLIVIGNVLFPGWFFQGIEKMKYITFLNITSRTLVTLMIFIFIDQKDEYVLALFIHSFSYLLPGLIGVFILIRKYNLRFTLVSFNEIRKSVVEGWHIFITSFLGNIIASSGIFILGMTSNNSIVGIYSSIEKIIKAVIGLFMPITQALFPYVSAKFAHSYDDGVSTVKKTGKIIMSISIMVSVIVIIFSSNILSVIYGSEVAEYSIVMQILVIWLLFSILNNIIGYQYLIASKQEKMYSNSFVKASFITILLYVVFTNQFSIYGVIAAMLIGEIALTLLMISSIVRLKKSSKKMSKGARI